jgi:F-type H+-transporting ATPase subunit b
MQSLITRLTTLAGLALAAAPSLAADQGHDTHAAEKAGVLPTIAQGIVPMLVAIGVFAVVFIVLAKMVWPKILGGLKDRENKIREEIEAAEMARAQAKDALEQYQQSLAQARAEAQKMIETTRAQQATLAAELRSKADAELNAMRERAMRDIETAKRAAVAEIYNMGTALAVSVASKVLRRNVTADDTQRLVEESLQQLQTAGKN